MIEGFSNFRRLFRFPYLKEGNTAEKRDRMLKFLLERGYRMGYVTIDTSEWAIDDRLRKRLKNEPNADLTAYRDLAAAFVKPNLVEILTVIDGVSFDEVWADRVEIELAGVSVPIMGRESLLANRRASGRPKDLADVDWLERHESQLERDRGRRR